MVYQAAGRKNKNLSGFTDKATVRLSGYDTAEEAAAAFNVLVQFGADHLGWEVHEPNLVDEEVVARVRQRATTQVLQAQALAVIRTFVALLEEEQLARGMQQLVLMLLPCLPTHPKAVVRILEALVVHPADEPPSEALAKALGELLGLGLGCTRHAREFRVHAKVVLVRDRSECLALGLNRYPFLRLDRLVQAVTPPPPLHFSPRELVDDLHLALVH